MADKLIIDCSKPAAERESTARLTAAEESERVQLATSADADRTAATQRQARRAQAIVRLNDFVALGAGATAAQVRTESQFVAKVLAKVLPFIDIDPA